VDLAGVARHAVTARRRWKIHGLSLIVIRLALLSAVVAVLTGWLVAAAAVVVVALLPAWFSLFWAVRADRSSALRV
jgi:hypothetical protein